MDRIREPDQVAHGRRGANVLQSRRIRALQAFLAERLVLRVEVRRLAVERLEVRLVREVAEPVDARGLDAVAPEIGVLLVGETVDVAWTTRRQCVAGSEISNVHTRCKGRHLGDPS